MTPRDSNAPNASAKSRNLDTGQTPRDIDRHGPRSTNPFKEGQTFNLGAGISDGQTESSRSLNPKGHGHPRTAGAAYPLSNYSCASLLRLCSPQPPVSGFAQSCSHEYKPRRPVARPFCKGRLSFPRFALLYPRADSALTGHEASRWPRHHGLRAMATLHAAGATI